MDADGKTGTAATRAETTIPARPAADSRSVFTRVADTRSVFTPANKQGASSQGAGNGLDEPSSESPSSTLSSTTDRLGAAAAAAFESTLERGRQAWRQALTGPNNWLSGRSSSSSSSPGSSSPGSAETGTPAAPSGYSGSAFDNGSGYGGPAGNSGYAPAGYSTGTSSAASYGGPAAGTPTRTGSAWNGSSGSSSSGGTATRSSSSGSPFGRGSNGASSPAPATAGLAGAAAAAGAGAAFAGSRPSAAATATPPRPAVSVKGAKGKRKDSRRQAQLTLSRVEPWSVMKFSFLVSVVAFIVLFVAVALLYMVLSSLGVFESLQHTVSNLTSAKNQTGTNVSSWFSESRILGYTGMLGALNIVLITALSTIGAVVYNLIAQTIGGVEVTLRETD